MALTQSYSIYELTCYADIMSATETHPDTSSLEKPTIEAPGPTPSPGEGRNREAWLLTDVVTRLRRVLRSSVRSDYPWETLPMAQVEVLQRLAEEPDLRVNELAQRHRLSPNTVSALIQQMVLAELVTRVTAEGDRRAVALRLTELGRTRLSGWREANQRTLTSALTQLPPKDRNVIRSALPALAALAGELEQLDRRSQPQGDTE